MYNGVITATGGNSTQWNTAYNWGNHAWLYPLIADSNKTSTGNYVTRKYYYDHLPSGGTGTVTNVATGFGLTGGPITTTGTLLVDTSKIVTFGDTAAVGGKIATKKNLAYEMAGVNESLAYKASTGTTLTINGTTQDLSANRTWSVGTLTTAGYRIGVSGATVNNLDYHKTIDSVSSSIPFSSTLLKMVFSDTTSGKLYRRSIASIFSSPTFTGTSTIPKIVTTQPSITGGAGVNIISVTGGTQSGVDAGSEVTDININLARTIQHNGGAIANQRSIVISTPTLTAVSATTIADADGVVISGGPTGGTNTTLTESCGLVVETKALTNVTTGYSLKATAPTGATNNYALGLSGKMTTNNQIISTLATGTAPVSVASTTLCTNLNADMVDGVHGTAVKLYTDIVPLFGTAVDSTLINTTMKFPLGFSNGIVVDTLKFIATTTGGNTTCNITPKLYYGSDISATGTAVVTSPSAITSRTTATAVSSFNNATIAKGNMMWLIFTDATSKPRNFMVQLIGHKQ